MLMIKEPAKVAELAGGKTAYAGKDAKVVLNGEGKFHNCHAKKQRWVERPESEVK